jgi:hypothetical protein
MNNVHGNPAPRTHVVVSVLMQSPHRERRAYPLAVPTDSSLFANAGGV